MGDREDVSGLGLILSASKFKQWLKQDRNVFLSCAVAWRKAAPG